MLEVLVRRQDVSRVRLARSPLRELFGSMAAVLHPARGAPHRRWLEATLPAIARLRIPLLRALAGQGYGLPDCLLPVPAKLNVDIAGEIEQVRWSDPALVSEVYAGAGPQLAERPERLLPSLAQELTAYWKAAMEPVWPRVKALLEQDLIYRGELMVTGGVEAVMAGLDPRIAFHTDRITVSGTGRTERLETRGEAGIVLVPSAFIHPYASVAVRSPLVITYGARGVGNLWTAAGGAAGALGGLVGETRARILTLLDLPRSTADLAGALDLGASTISEHLAILLGCDLVWKVRHGRKVFYQRTLKGSRLIADVSLPDIAQWGPLELS